MNILLKIIIGIVFVFFSNQNLSQEIDKLGKKELRIAYISKSGELDSLQQLFNNTSIAMNKEIMNLSHEIDNLKNQMNKNEIKCTETTNTLTLKNKSLIESISLLQDSLQNSTSNYELRKIFIEMFLRNRVYKLRCYESYSGVGPDGASIYKIAKIDNKYYTCDEYGNNIQKIESTNTEQTKEFNNWELKIDDNCKFQYIEPDENKTGTINKTSIKWRDDSYSDSLYNSSVIFGENYIKLPIAVFELETIRGSFDFFVYLYIGVKDFYFNEKQYSSFCPIILESIHIQTILTE